MCYIIILNHFSFSFALEHPLNIFLRISVILLSLLTLTSCTTSVDSAIKKGAELVKAPSIYSLVNNSTIRLITVDFEADVFLQDNGKLSARGLIYGTKDTGLWDIKSDDRLCLKFSVWYYGDVNCYSVYKEAGKDSYQLFTDNGAAVYTMTVAPGNVSDLAVIDKKGRDATFVRSEMKNKGGPTPSYRPPASTSSPAPAPEPVAAAPVTGPAASDEEINHTVKSMALDCPGCNLRRADLRQADLIGANLKGANLSGANLSHANLRRANLEGADLSDAMLISTNMPGANLKNADCTSADFTGSNLIQADFTGADIDNIILDNTLQEGTKGL